MKQSGVRRRRFLFSGNNDFFLIRWRKKRIDLEPALAYKIITVKKPDRQRRIIMEKWIRARFQPGLPLGSDGRRVTAGKEHIALSRRAAREGMVLLKNENNALPLPAGCRIALFGKATFDYVKGGGGSGDVQSQMTDSGIWIMKIMSPEKK